MPHDKDHHPDDDRPRKPRRAPHHQIREATGDYKLPPRQTPPHLQVPERVESYTDHSTKPLYGAGTYRSQLTRDAVRRLPPTRLVYAQRSLDALHRASHLQLSRQLTALQNRTTTKLEQHLAPAPTTSRGPARGEYTTRFTASQSALANNTKGALSGGLRDLDICKMFDFSAGSMRSAFTLYKANADARQLLNAHRTQLSTERARLSLGASIQPTRNFFDPPKPTKPSRDLTPPPTRSNAMKPQPQPQPIKPIAPAKPATDKQLPTKPTGKPAGIKQPTKPSDKPIDKPDTLRDPKNSRRARILNRKPKEHDKTKELDKPLNTKPTTTKPKLDDRDRDF